MEKTLYKYEEKLYGENMGETIGKVSTRDMYTLAAAATGAAINRADDSEELKEYLIYCGGFMALPAAYKIGKSAIWDFPKFMINNHGNYGNAFKNVYDNTIRKTTLYKANREALKGNFWNTVEKNSILKQIENTPAEDISKLREEIAVRERQNRILKVKNTDGVITRIRKNIKTRKNTKEIINKTNRLKYAEIYEDVKNLKNKAKNLSGKRLRSAKRAIEIAETKAAIAINNAKAAGEIKKTSKLGRTLSNIKNKTGLRTIENKILKGTMSKNKLVRTASKGLKCVKGGGAMAAISLAMEVPTIIETYQKLGSDSGEKQIVKSTVKVAADTVGFIAGAKIGGLAGAKIGAIIGTTIGGPIGTVIGGAVGAGIGIIGGIVGSWACGKLAREIVGDDEIEIADRIQTQKLAVQARKDTALQAEIATVALQNLENGEIAENDVNDVVNSLKRVSKSLSQNETIKTQTEVPQTNNTTINNKQQETDDTDDGLKALYSLSKGEINENRHNNPFASYTNSFNPFINNFNNVQYYNPAA